MEAADRNKPRKYRIIITEDYTIVREGLRSLLSSYPDLEIVGEAEDGREAIRCVEQLKPDLVLMDLSLPRTDGMTAIQEIKSRSPDTKILVLTVHKTEGYVRRALEAGADGYILKDANYYQLETAIRSVLSGKPYLSPGISDGIIKGYLMGVKSSSPETRLSTLTPREIEIFKLVAEGYKSKDIADYLFISVNTVDKHRANIMKKLNLHSISALTTLALKEGLVDK